MKKQGVCYTVALPFTLKSISRQKAEELWKFKYFHHEKNNNLHKNPLKENQNPSRYY
jgi:hypothetical protein